MNTREVLAVGFLSSAALMGACQTNPETGQRSFLSLSKEDEIRIGEEAGPAMTKEFGGQVNSEPCQRYVTQVGLKLKGHIDRQDYLDLPWQFTLLESDVINAFALPGGKVYITRGLAGKLASEGQMAGILGHEIGHVTAEHGDQRITSQTWFNIGMAAAAIGVGVADSDSTFAKYGQVGLPALAVGGNLVLLSYGRDEEIEADSLGMGYMARAGYNPRAQREVMEILGNMATGERPPEFLSTHPTSATRIRRIDGALAGEHAATQGNPAYQVYAERYKKDFLGPLAKAPEPARPAKQTALPSPVLWCAHCRAAVQEWAEKPGPVGAGEGLYRFVSPAARP